MQLEIRVLDADIRQARFGSKCGLTLGIALVGASCVMALSGNALAGTILGSVDIAAVVGTFVYGTERRRSERTQRVEKMTGGRH